MTEPTADRERRVRLANMRQELLAPVTGLVGYGELLSEEAERLEIGPLSFPFGSAIKVSLSCSSSPRAAVSRAL